MSQDIQSADRRSESGPDIVAAVTETDAGREYVIADVSRDGSWLSVVEREAVSLNGRR